MNKEALIKIAESVGATHKQNLGVYQFYQDELHEFSVEVIKYTVKECCDIIRETRWAVPPTQEQIAKNLMERLGEE